MGQHFVEITCVLLCIGAIYLSHDADKYNVHVLQLLICMSCRNSPSLEIIVTHHFNTLN